MGDSETGIAMRTNRRGFITRHEVAVSEPRMSDMQASKRGFPPSTTVRGTRPWSNGRFNRMEFISNFRGPQLLPGTVEKRKEGQEVVLSREWQIYEKGETTRQNEQEH